MDNTTDIGNYPRTSIKKKCKHCGELLPDNRPTSQEIHHECKAEWLRAKDRERYPRRKKQRARKARTRKENPTG